MSGILLTVSSGEAELAETINQLTDIETLADPTLWEKFIKSLPETLMNLGFRVLFAGIIFFIGTKLIRMLSKLIVKSLSKTSADKGAINFLNACVRVVLFVILIMLIASSFGVDAASIIAILGSAGLTIGLALQGSLANMAGGLIILLMHPFRIDDYIIESSYKYEGTVKDIHIFYTTLYTIDNKEVMIPNGALCNTAIINVTRVPHRQLDYSIGISYDSDLLLAKETLMSILSSLESRVEDREPIVFVRELGESAVVLGGRVWIESINYWKTFWHINEAVKLTYDKLGIVIPFNQLDVHLDTPGEAAKKADVK